MPDLPTTTTQPFRLLLSGMSLVVAKVRRFLPVPAGAPGGGGEGALGHWIMIVTLPDERTVLKLLFGVQILKIVLFLWEPSTAYLFSP